MYITSVDISIQFLDSDGNPASLGHHNLSGVVRNSLGDVVQTLTMDDMTESQTGLYVLNGYDVSDSNVFPGTSLTIFWSTHDHHVQPEVSRQTYALFAEHPSYVRSRYLIWEPSPLKSSFYGYKVSRKLPGETEYTVVGNTTFPYFFEETEFDVPNTFHAAKYKITELNFGSLNQDVPSEGITGISFKRVESPHQHCRLYGRITDVQGSGYPAMISFFVHEVDTPQEIGGSHLMRRNEVNVYPNARGEFSIPLVQGALVTAEASDICVNARFVVPREYSFNFKDLEFYPLDTTYRAQ